MGKIFSVTSGNPPNQFFSVNTGAVLPGNLGAVDWFIYNNVPLLLVNPLQVNRQAIYNGPDYLYTRHTVHVMAYFSPGYTSYIPAWLNGAGFQGGMRTPDPIFQFGNSPAVTDNAVRSALLEPRRQLWWIKGPHRPGAPSWVFLASPDVKLGATVDANNGPIPLFCNVDKIHGTKTFVVTFLIQTDLNENYGFGTNFPPPLLSNRWEMDQSWDDQFFTTRTIRGRAVFRTDALTLLNARPDDYRDWLFFPVPPGFKRLPTSIRQNAEGTMIDYVITDQEQQISVLSSLQTNYGVVDIQGIHNITQSSHGLEAVIPLVGEALFGMGKAGLQGKDKIRQLKAAGAPKGKMVGAGAVGALNVITEAIKGLAEVGWAMLPVQAHTFTVRVWGDGSSNRDKLTTVAFFATQQRLQQTINAVPLGTVAFDSLFFSLTHDIRKKFVELTSVIKSGPLVTGWLPGLGIPNQNPMKGMEFIQNITGPNTVENPYPRGAALLGQPNKSRGTYLADLTAAVLAPNYVPAAGSIPDSYYPPQQTSSVEPRPTPRGLP